MLCWRKLCVVFVGRQLYTICDVGGIGGRMYRRMCC